MKSSLNPREFIGAKVSGNFASDAERDRVSGWSVAELAIEEKYRHHGTHRYRPARTGLGHSNHFPLS
jgi:hypothetical protein